MRAKRIIEDATFFTRHVLLLIDICEDLTLYVLKMFSSIDRMSRFKLILTLAAEYWSHNVMF